MGKIRDWQYNRHFEIKEDVKSGLTYLGYDEDPMYMNWIEGKRNWGEIIAPPEIEASVERTFTPEGNFREVYTFRNCSAFPVLTGKTDLGIYATFNDNYEEAAVCLEKRCHTHIFCGLEAGWIMALRMSGRPPHLGMKVIKGSIAAYSVERDPEERSNDRGDFILHPETVKLEPGECMCIEWELFWFETRKEFYKKLLDTPGFPVAVQEQCTWYMKETAHVKIMCTELPEGEKPVLRHRGRNIPYRLEKQGEYTCLSAEVEASVEGESRIDVLWGGRRTYVLFFFSPVPEKLAERRCSFLMERQQMHDTASPLDGAYLIYDREDGIQYYSHQDDHNGGRERLAMGVLMALWLQSHRDGRLAESLDRYEEYVYRELFEKETGTVFNDINHSLDWDRLYNYPWMSVFQLELYRLKNDESYLLDAYRTLIQYYRKGGIRFYGIGLPVSELYEELGKNGNKKEADELACLAEQNADFVLKNGLRYPGSEVAYEQSIVAPAVSILLQVYEITGKKVYLDEAERQLEVLSLFNGRQPDYHMFENAIRHWDGYWFGKYRRYGDTFPHYWSVLTGVEYVRYEKLTGASMYRKNAEASLRGCLNLFLPDGSASCAMVYPAKINGADGHYYDPWANDQDWALYYALKYRG